MVGSEHLWPCRFHERLHFSTRQYSRLVRDWVASIGLAPSAYGTHSMRRTKVAQFYRKTGNLRAVLSFSVIPRWTARSATSASKSQMRWRSRSRWKSDQQGPVGSGRRSADIREVVDAVQPHLQRSQRRHLVEALYP